MDPDAKRLQFTLTRSQPSLHAGERRMKSNALSRGVWCGRSCVGFRPAQSDQVDPPAAVLSGVRESAWRT